MFFIPPETPADRESKRNGPTYSTSSVTCDPAAEDDSHRWEILRSPAQPTKEMNLALRLLLGLVLIVIAAFLSVTLGKWVLVVMGLGLCALHGFMKGLRQPVTEGTAETAD
jgi:hypothetical protein